MRSFLVGILIGLVLIVLLAIALTMFISFLGLNLIVQSFIGVIFGNIGMQLWMIFWLEVVME